MLSKPKQSSCKKRVRPPKGSGKKYVNPRWWPRNGCDSRLMEKKFNNDSSAEFVLPPPCFTRIRHQIHLNCRYLKFLPLTYHHSHFLATTLDLASFLTLAFLEATLFFLQLGCFGLDITSFCIASHKASHQLALALPFNLFVFLTAGIVEQKPEAIIKTHSSVLCGPRSRHATP